jgi:sulfite reductase (NADPH) hemoprotein beta-component
MIKTKSGHFRLTGNQHVILAGITSEQLPYVKELLAKYKLDNLNFSGLRLSSYISYIYLADGVQFCLRGVPYVPQLLVFLIRRCGLAMAESERYLPTLITKLEDTLAEAGLRNSSIVMRMTGCPNGCARPWVAELACVGKAPGTYNLMLGGGYHGERLNKLYRYSLGIRI